MQVSIAKPVPGRQLALYTRYQRKEVAEVLVNQLSKSR